MRALLFLLGLALFGLPNHAVAQGQTPAFSLLGPVCPGNGGALCQPVPAATGCSAAPTLDTSASNNVSGTSTGVTASTTAGNEVIVVVVKVSAVSNGAQSTVTDNSAGGPLTWTKRKEQQFGGTTADLAVFSAPTGGSALSSFTITGANTGSGTSIRVSYAAFKGANTSSPWDSNASLPAITSNSGTAVSTLSLSSLATTNPCDVMIAVLGGTGTTGISPFTEPTGFAALISGGTGTVLDISSKSVTSAQTSFTATYSWSGGANAAVMYFDAIESP